MKGQEGCPKATKIEKISKILDEDHDGKIKVSDLNKVLIQFHSTRALKDLTDVMKQMVHAVNVGLVCYIVVWSGGVWW